MPQSSSRTVATELPFGKGRPLRFSLPPEVLVGCFPAPRGTALTDVATATHQALAAPLGLPALEQIAFPGDSVVVAVEPETPQAIQIVTAVVEVLRASGVAADLIALLTARGPGGADPPCLTDSLPAESSGRVRQLIHDPKKSRDLCRIGESRSGRPLVVHRALFDADLVITIGTVAAAESLGYFGVHGVLHPTFADAPTQRRYRAPCLFDDPARFNRLAAREAAEVAWLLGSQFTVQVVPGAADDVLNLVAGAAEAVETEGQRRYAEAWNFQLPQRAQLVVATLEGEAASRGWDPLARALEVALRIVSDDGDIAICSRLEAQPGPALRDLARSANPESAVRRIRRQRSDDMPAATQLAKAIDRGRVFLLSDLDPATVEGLGIAPVSEPAEIERLAARAESCILLGNAQHLVAMAATAE